MTPVAALSMAHIGPPLTYESAHSAALGGWVGGGGGGGGKRWSRQ